MTDELNKIVAGLSDAQKETILHPKCASSVPRPNCLCEDDWGKLYELKIVSPTLDAPSGIYLTQLGLAVRAHLQKEQTP